MCCIGSVQIEIEIWKSLVYCRLRRVKSNVSSVAPSVAHVSLWRRANARNVRLYYQYWQYKNLFHISICNLNILLGVMYNQLAYFMSHYYLLSDEGPTLETLDYTIRIGSTPTFSYFDLYLNTAYTALYVYCTILILYEFTDLLNRDWVLQKDYCCMVTQVLTAFQLTVVLMVHYWT